MFALDKSETIFEKAASLIQAAQRAVTLTGAGVSTPSGIPDFRSSTSGLWERYDPMEVASLSAFRFQAKKFFNWFRPLAEHIHAAQPNSAHYALAKIENAGHLTSIITQNIDGLHQKAGSTKVFEVHGSITRMVCTHCYTEYPSEHFYIPYIQEANIPRCPACQHTLKPDVVLFEEQLPLKTWKLAEQAATSCDLMLVAGTSLMVFPAANLPLRALEHGVPLIIINQSPTYLDERATLVIRGDIAEILPRLVQEVLGE